MIQDQILSFLRTQQDFIAQTTAEQQQDWLAGLNTIALPKTEAATKQLLPAQIAAWEGMAPYRAALLLGPPGTGKTFALSWMVLGYLEARRAAGKPTRILVTGFTREAIANLLEAIYDRATEAGGLFPRLAYLGNAPTNLDTHIERLTDSDAQKALEDAGGVVLGATTWGLYRLLDGGGFPGSDGPTAPLFDLVCIDEASQMVLAQGLMALGGLKPDGRVVVAGDDKQLAPIRSMVAPEGAATQLTASLYSFLKTQDSPEFRLDETFRLNKPLVAFPAERFYEGEFYSADPVAERRLELASDWEKGLQPWERLVLDPEHPVCILLHDGPPAGTHNAFEATLIRRLVELFWKRSGTDDPRSFWGERLAVITPHRAQNAAIRESLSGQPFGKDAVVETVDRIQGRERDLILAGYTVSDEEFALLEAPFIFSPERLNVTITRPRSKLILLVSRRLLEAIPTDEAVFEAAQVLRDFALHSREVASLAIPYGDTKTVDVTFRVRSFDAEAALPDLTPVPTETTANEDLPPLTAAHHDVLEGVRRLTPGAAQYQGWVADFALRKELAQAIRFELLRDLQRHGHVRLRQSNGKFGPFWQMQLLDPPRPPRPIETETFAAHLEEAVEQSRRGKKPPFYDDVRHHFDWLGPDALDRLRPLVDALVASGDFSFDFSQPDRPRLERVDRIPPEVTPVPAPAENLTDEDFEVLNALEDQEIRLINFGVFERWSTLKEFARQLGKDRLIVDASLRRLSLHGHVMRTEDGRIRSRTAELAREVRYVKQRFAPGDAQKRPYVVRALRVEALERQKPKRDVRLSGVLARLRTVLQEVPEAAQALDGLAAMLRIAWSLGPTDDPELAGFQARALETMLPAWLGISSDDSFVITADTGSGKTEAACFPLILGAALDRMRGIRGVRAVLVYPRIALGTNQAQRLARYLAALAQVPGLPRLTLGIQNGAVPTNFDRLPRDHETWTLIGNARSFPFFKCPDCEHALLLKPRLGDSGVDRLECEGCSWHFDGWVGSKDALRANPPALFLPVTESLHQWLHNPKYAPLFGDTAFAAPRAVLADEIHLYSLVHGAQVGFTLRRLLARLTEKNALVPLAIGMSATLGRPGETWGQLAGRPHVVEVTATATEREKNPRAREIFYFVQPEVESRGSDIAGASTTIQSLMTLAHGMRRRTGTEGGYRGVVFLDSIDKVKRLHTDYRDAEEGKKLAQLRTYLYDDDPITKAPRRQCCGSPETCDSFKDGECWYFAATDEAQWQAGKRYRPGRPLTVAPRPVTSQAGGRVEDMIRESDIVFSTSSLEVGYDDPDIMLVYQHYAPVNLASFIQRKGRGGRGSDDRPITGVTLSVYSPRDSYFFRHPRRMLEPLGFEIPLNMDNHFVRRGQAIALLVDCAARLAALKGRIPWPLPQAFFDRVEQILVQVMGSEALLTLNVSSVRDLWNEALRQANGNLDPADIPAWRLRLPWIPRLLFDALSLPMLAVDVPPESESASDAFREEDIALVLSESAPGNVTRRYGIHDAHWIVPVPGRAPMGGLDLGPDGCTRVDFHLDGPAMLADLSLDARKQIGPLASGQIIRPKRLKLEKAGRFLGSVWTPAWEVGETPQGLPKVQSPQKAEGLPITAKSRAFLRGFLMVQSQSNCGKALNVPQLVQISEKFEAFLGEPNGKPGTGLHAARVFWGVDASLVTEEERKRVEVPMQQTFCDPASGETVIVGYAMETEGVRLQLTSVLLDAFVADELARLAGTSEERWLRDQLRRYLLQSRLGALSINVYQAQLLAEILSTAMAIASERDEVEGLLELWDAQEFMAILHRIGEGPLAHHPLVTPRRIQRLEALVTHPRFRDTLSDVLAQSDEDIVLAGYLRSLVLHGVAIRLQNAVVLHGRGDERRVLFHARLPIQFGADANDVLTVFENGEHGDGTTRTFLASLDEAFSEWTPSELAACPNAEEDMLLERLDVSREAVWELQARDPRDPHTLDRLARLVGLDPQQEEQAVQIMAQLVWTCEELDGERFARLELRQELVDERIRLEREFGRPATAWELVSRVVQAAEADRLPTWARLLKAYARMEDVTLEEALSPASRLADQAYRLSAKLCADGCKACLHLDSSLMPSQQAEVAVSRRVLQRFGRFAEEY